MVTTTIIGSKNGCYAKRFFSNAVTRERWSYRSIESLLFVLSMTFDPQCLIVFKKEISSSSDVRDAETDFPIDSNFGLAMRSHFLRVKRSG